MTYYGLPALVVGHAGAVLLLAVALVARTGRCRPLPGKSIVIGVASIVAGVLLLLHAHWGWGLLGPVAQLRSIPERVAFLNSLGPDRMDYWDFTNPSYHSGILAYGFLIGAGAILWSSVDWSRRVILVSSGVLAGLCALRLAAPLWSRGTYPMYSAMAGPDLVTVGLAVAIASLLLVLCPWRAEENPVGRSSPQ